MKQAYLKSILPLKSRPRDGSQRQTFDTRRLVRLCSFKSKLHAFDPDFPFEITQMAPIVIPLPASNAALIKIPPVP